MTLGQTLLVLCVVTWGWGAVAATDGGGDPPPEEPTGGDKRTTTARDSTEKNGQETVSSGVLFIKEFVSHNALYAYIVLDVVLGIHIVALNTIVFVFYYRRLHRREKNYTYYLLYVMLSTFDITTGIVAFLHALMLRYTIDYHKSAVRSICYPITILQSVSSHMSVFTNMLLTSKRTVDIYRAPSGPIKNELQILVGSLILYSLVWISLSCLDIYSIETNPTARIEENILMYIIAMPRSHFSVELLKKFVQPNQEDLVYCLIFVGIPYVLPTIIATICSVLQIDKLYFEKIARRSMISKRITTTILILTVAFFVCNTTFMVYYLADYQNWKVGFETLKKPVVSYIFANYPNFMNSLINPVILITRGKDIKRFTLQQVSTLMALSRTTNLDRVNNLDRTSRLRTKSPANIASDDVIQNMDYAV